MTVFCVHHNRHVYHSIKELHLWNLPCLPNCLDDRYLDDSIDETLRETLLGNDLDHTGYFFHDLWFGDVDNLFQVRGQTRSCGNNRTTSTISSTTCGTDSFVTCIATSTSKV